MKSNLRPRQLIARAGSDLTQVSRGDSSSLSSEAENPGQTVHDLSREGNGAKIANSPEVIENLPSRLDAGQSFVPDNSPSNSSRKVFELTRTDSFEDQLPLEAVNDSQVPAHPLSVCFQNSGKNCSTRKVFSLKALKPKQKQAS